MWPRSEAVWTVSTLCSHGSLGAGLQARGGVSAKTCAHKRGIPLNPLGPSMPMCNSTHAVLAFTLCYIGVLWVMVWLSAMLLITDELGKFPASPHAAMPAFTPSPT